MAKAKNKVISGDYVGASVDKFLGEISLNTYTTDIALNKYNIANIELIDSSSKKDTGSTIARGIVGGILLGPAGLVGGAILGKTNGIHLLSIAFKNGKKSLLEIDDDIYKELIKKMY